MNDNHSNPAPTSTTTPPPPPPTQQPLSGLLARADQALHTLFAVLLLLAALLTTLALATLWRARATPPWWSTVSPTDPIAIQRAESLEIRLNNTLSNPAPPPPTTNSDIALWTIDITPEEANAWINLRLPRWLANRELPAPFEPGSLTIAFRDGKLIAGARLPASADEHQHIVGVTLAPRIDEQHNLIAPITAFHLGSLSLPRAIAADRLTTLIPPEYAQDPDVTAALDALLHAKPLTHAPTLSSDNHHAVRILAIDITPQRARLHCTTLPRD